MPNKKKLLNATGRMADMTNTAQQQRARKRPCLSVSLPTRMRSFYTIHPNDQLDAFAPDMLRNDR